MDVEGDPNRRIDLVLHHRCHGRKGQVRRGGCNNDQVNIRSLTPRRRQSTLSGNRGQIRGELSLSSTVALANACALDDPLVVGIDKFGQIGVGDNI